MNNVKIYAATIEDEALAQINEISTHPAFSNSNIRIMPDVHSGKGCVIGFTAEIGDKIIPNIVGVDIGCAVEVTSLGKIAIDFAALDRYIQTYIPSGFNIHDVAPMTISQIEQLHCYDYLSNHDRFGKALGTLGGGNHYIEIGEGSDGTRYLSIHSGSRNLGKQVAEYYQACAIANNNHENPSLCYLEGGQAQHYLHDMELCMEYAALNRELMSRSICNFLGVSHSYTFTTVHNYVGNGYVRKGAVSAQKGEQLIIPINMRDGSLICIGKGNADWNYSAPHGAGRLMSRGKAKRTLQLDDVKEEMTGVYTTSLNLATIDEAPAAYKAMEEIMSQIYDTVDICDIVKPLYNFKGSNLTKR